MILIDNWFDSNSGWKMISQISKTDGVIRIIPPQSPFSPMKSGKLSIKGLPYQISDPIKQRIKEDDEVDGLYQIKSSSVKKVFSVDEYKELAKTEKVVTREMP